jgi:acyl carrier protein
VFLSSGAAAAGTAAVRGGLIWLARDLITPHASALKISMNTSDELNAQIKSMLVENLMLQISAGEIGDDQPLFGPGSLGLDSVDALQLVVALEKNYGVKISDPQVAKKALQTVNQIAATVRESQSQKK